MSVTAHKMYGPKGVGALYVRHKKPEVHLAPLIDGGGHELGMRSGTLNVAGIVGLGKACELSMQEMVEESRRLSALRDCLKHGILSRLEGVHINGSMERRLPQNLNLSFDGVEGEALITCLDGIAVSSGAACRSMASESSYVLRALGTGEDRAQSSIRFGLGRFNTQEEVDYVIGRVVEAVKSLREFALLRPERQQSPAPRVANSSFLQPGHACGASKLMGVLVWQPSSKPNEISTIQCMRLGGRVTKTTRFRLIIKDGEEPLLEQSPRWCVGRIPSQQQTASVSQLGYPVRTTALEAETRNEV
jgi:hypothetical protein